MSETTKTVSAVFRRPDLSFQGWREYVHSTNRADLSHATATSYEAWYLARAALRFRLSKAIIIRDKTGLRNLDAVQPGPKPHQVEGLLFFWNTAGKRCYFADDVGLGKTYTTTLIVHQLIQHGSAKSRGVGPDGGIDIEAQSPEGRAILIQVKKYSSPVRKELVEEFHQRSLSSAFGLTLPELWFVAPVLTEGARAFCATNMMKAIERQQLAGLLSQALKNGLDPDRLLVIDPGSLG